MFLLKPMESDDSKTIEKVKHWYKGGKIETTPEFTNLIDMICSLSNKNFVKLAIDLETDTYDSPNRYRWLDLDIRKVLKFNKEEIKFLNHSEERKFFLNVDFNALIKRMNEKIGKKIDIKIFLDYDSLQGKRYLDFLEIGIDEYDDCNVCFWYVRLLTRILRKFDKSFSIEHCSFINGIEKNILNFDKRFSEYVSDVEDAKKELIKMKKSLQEYDDFFQEALICGEGRSPLSHGYLKSHRDLAISKGLQLSRRREKQFQKFEKENMVKNEELLTLINSAKEKVEKGPKSFKLIIDILYKLLYYIKKIYKFIMMFCL